MMAHRPLVVEIRCCAESTQTRTIGFFSNFYVQPPNFYAWLASS